MNSQQPKMLCVSCTKVFPLPFDLNEGAMLTLDNNKISCPKCGHMQSMPNISVRATIKGLITALKESQDPRSEIEKLRKELEEIKSQRDLDFLRKKQESFSLTVPNSLDAVNPLILLLVAILIFMSSNNFKDFNGIDINISIDSIVKIYNEQKN